LKVVSTTPMRVSPTPFAIASAMSFACPLESCAMASMPGVPEPFSYMRLKIAPGAFGAIIITSTLLGGTICLKWMLKPWLKQSALPFFI
jgi:hypothetical protein